MSNVLHILFGTETGNAEDLANRTLEKAKKLGLETTIENVADISVDKLKEYQKVLIVISTWGDGDPPGEATDFCEAIEEGELTDVSHLQYTVLALGDHDYEDFCGCGRKVDEGLAKAGAQKYMDREELDVDFEDAYEAWADRFFKAIKVGEIVPEASPDKEMEKIAASEPIEAIAPKVTPEITGTPAVCSLGPKRLEVFVRGKDTHLWHKAWDGEKWGSWQDLGGSLASDPACVARAPNRIDCFAKGIDSSLWHKTWDGEKWSDWMKGI